MKNKLIFNKIKTIQLNVRVSEDILTKIDKIAKENKVERTEAIRALIEYALNN